MLHTTQILAFLELRTEKTPRECRRERLKIGIQPVAFHNGENATGSRTVRMFSTDDCSVLLREIPPWRS
jgi:hypothetical protein